MSYSVLSVWGHICDLFILFQRVINVWNSLPFLFYYACICIFSFFLHCILIIITFRPRYQGKLLVPHTSLAVLLVVIACGFSCTLLSELNDDDDDDDDDIRRMPIYSSEIKNNFQVYCLWKSVCLLWQFNVLLTDYVM